MKGLDPEKWTRDETPKSFFNPLEKSFTFSFLDDDNNPILVEIPSRTLLTKPTYLADLCIKRLVEEVSMYRNGGIYVGPEKKEELLKEILI